MGLPLLRETALARPATAAAPAHLASKPESSLSDVDSAAAHRAAASRESLLIGASLLLTPSSAMLMVAGATLAGLGPGAQAALALVGLGLGPILCTCALSKTQDAAPLILR